MIKISESKSESSIVNHLYKTLNPRRLSTTVSLLHKIPTDCELSLCELTDEYDIEKTLAEGYYAKIFLTNHKPTKSNVVLKACHVELTNVKEFIKEFHYNYQVKAKQFIIWRENNEISNLQLSHHPQILSCYQVKFQTKDYYVFAMELAPYGDLAAHVGATGIPESCCKKISDQLSSALGFMHLKSLVHRDLKLENILVFALDFSRIKLCDFGATTKQGVLVNRNNNCWISFLPPEVLEVLRNERYVVKSSSDTWQFGIVLFICLTGTSPWLKADWVSDSKYCAFMKYQKRETTKIPENFKKFSPRLLRAFRRMFDHNEEDRAKVTDIMKYAKDKWLNTKLSQSKSQSNVLNSSFRVTANCPSDRDSIKYINHKESRQAVDEKGRIKRLMSTFGIQQDKNPNEDQASVEIRVSQWLQQNESNFTRFDHMEDDLDLNFWRRESDKSPYS